jgi:hypothetical protein
MRYRVGPPLGQAEKRHEQGVLRYDWCAAFIDVFDVSVFGSFGWTHKRIEPLFQPQGFRTCSVIFIFGSPGIIVSWRCGCDDQKRSRNGVINDHPKIKMQYEAHMYSPSTGVCWYNSLLPSLFVGMSSRVHCNNTSILRVSRRARIIPSRKARQGQPGGDRNP